jgi:glycoside hydrolase family 5
MKIIALKRWMPAVLLIALTASAGENLFRSATVQQGKYGTFDKAANTINVTIPHGTPVTEATEGVRFSFDNSMIAGKTVRFSFQLRTRDVRNIGGKPHHNAKLLLTGATKSNVYFKGSKGMTGTSDWTDVVWQVPFYGDNTRLTAVFGLQNSTGSAEFRNIRAELCDPIAPFRLRQSLPADFRCEYSPAIRNTPRLRGVVAEYYVFDDPRAMDTLSAWNVNAIRLWLGAKGSNLNYKTYEAEIDRQFERLKKLCPEFRKRGIRIIMTFRAPGGRFTNPRVFGTAGEISPKDNERSAFRLFESEEWLGLFVRLWKKAAETFRDEPVVWAYDLLNEPVQTAECRWNYLEVQKKAAEAIRSVDPEKPVVIASNYWGGAATFCYLQPLPLKNIIYQFHCYVPGTYTHQGLRDNMKRIKAGNPIRYPGMVEVFGLHARSRSIRYADKQLLREELRPVLEFQKKYGAIIYAGEFSVIRWAPDGSRYLNDMVSLLEEYGWHWTYHTFREKWNGWSLEHSDDWENRKMVPDSDRKQVMLKYFSLNKMERAQQ